MEEEWEEGGEGAEPQTAASAAAEHARLVALVRAAGGEPEGRVGVWMEHSYARAKSGAGAVRVVLGRAPEADDGDDALDVGDANDEQATAATEPEDDGDPEWETRVLSLAPTAMHLVAARSVLSVLRALRLARLARAAVADAAERRDAVRAAARKVRQVLAPLWAVDGGTVPPWLHGTLLAHASLSVATLWRAVAAELSRAVPRLAARLPPPPPRAKDPHAPTGPAVEADAPGPWLVWVCLHSPDRWSRRLRSLLHVRVVTGGDAPRAVSAAPDGWCAAAAGAVRQALLDILAEAGSRPVVVGGAGPGAAVCAALLAGGAGAAGGELSGVLALALLAPPLLTAEGEATHLHRAELDLPLLLVTGSASSVCPRSSACELLAGGAGSAARRAVVVLGADDALRLPARLRRRRVPQHALDAAVAEEVARWAVTAAEGETPRRLTRRGASANEAADERHSALHNARGLLREVEPPSVKTEPPRPAPRAVPLSRRPSATPVAPAPPPAPDVEELDIMQLPIVFADDEPPPPPPPPTKIQKHAPPLIKRAAVAAGPRPSVTVTSGHPRGGRALNYTRVIVAKRRGAGGPGGGAGGGVGRGARGGARPVLLRRTVRLLRGADT